MAWPRRAAIVAEARAVRPAGPVLPGDPRAETTAVAPAARADPHVAGTVAVRDRHLVTGDRRADARALPPTHVMTARAGAAHGSHRRARGCRNPASPRA